MIKKPGRPKKPEIIQTCIRVAKNDWDNLAIAAKNCGQSRNKILEMLISNWLKKNK
jgi:hypothetical protein